MDISKFLQENTIAFVPALYIIAMFIKKTEKIPNYLIPFILLAIGIILCIWTMGFSSDAIIQGIFTSGAAVFANQCKKQVVNGREDLKIKEEKSDSDNEK